MTFVQLIDCRTSQVEEMNRLLDKWVEQTQGKRTATHALVAQDRSDSTHVIEIVEFPSYEDAMRNSNLPETDRIFQEMVALCDEMPTFTDLDVVRDEQLNMRVARRLYDECVNQRRLDVLDEICSPDYQEHDANNDRDPITLAESKENMRQQFEAFTPTVRVENMLADGDLVMVRWDSTARHEGEFMGMPPTGKELRASGHSTLRFSEGRIVEAWWNWDLLHALREIGLIRFAE
ncbi:ester cyclase [Streptomyces sp. OF3]|uniref:Ester cyclase n=1 Tax=Streptomyces alkaliterrae TaxID=2213162 RepID=A0A7W3WKU2_9ACTN|nr:ester cyclase [Streptomyces alkaliterrae]MBB1254153.1 ester cyclase [Streptomyces alkaliterrae]